MEIISRIIDEKPQIPDNYCVFDIETTGLSHSFSRVILIGILFSSGGKTHIKQLFAKNRLEEKELLFYFKEIFKTFCGHISYNGFSFDIPFLNERFKKNNIDFCIDKELGIDILRMVRPWKELLGLESCKLKNVEELAGIYRTDTISGKESVQLYELFEKNEDSSIKEKILLHNYEDIYCLSKLLRLKEIIASKTAESSVPVIINGQSLLAFMESFKIRGSVLSIDYRLSANLEVPFELFEINFTIKSKDDRLFASLNLVKSQDNTNAKLLSFSAQSPIAVKINNSSIESNISDAGRFVLDYLSSL